MSGPRVVSTWRLATLALISCLMCLGAAAAEEDDASLSEPGVEELGAISVERGSALRELLARPPVSGSPAAIVEDALERAHAARELGESTRQIAELSQAIERIGARERATIKLHAELARAYIDRGEPGKSQHEREAALATATTPGERFKYTIQVALSAAQMHQMPRAREAVASAIEQARQLRRDHKGRQARGAVLRDAMVAFASASAARAEGHLDVAEQGFRACVRDLKRAIEEQGRAKASMGDLAICSHGLERVLLATGKLADAEAAALDVRRYATEFAESKRRPLFRIRSVVPAMAAVWQQQGRFDDAAKILAAGIAELQRLGLPEHSEILARFRGMLAQCEMARGRWPEADVLHQARYAGLKLDDSQAHAIGAGSPDWVYTQIRIGQVKAALDQARRIVAKRDAITDERSIARWEGHAFLGLALAADGQPAAALAELRVAVPRLLEFAKGERSSSEAGVLRAIRQGWLLDGYVALLAELARPGSAPIAGFDPVDEAFRYADLARGSVVQRALLAAVSRTRIDNPELAVMVRREQDVEREVSALSDAINNLLARGRVNVEDGIVAAMRKDLAALQVQQRQLRQSLAERFPEYGSLTDPAPAGIAEVARLLRPAQVLVSIYIGRDRSLVWVVPAKGQPQFSVAAVGSDEITQLVGRIRQSLEPRGDTVPPFDFAAANELYRLLLEPVAGALAGAGEIIFVPTRELGRIPLSLLTTSPPKPPAPEAAAPPYPFADYAGAPWLLRQAAISQLPSVSAFVSLRTASRTDAAALPFFGVGDPLFTTATATPTPLGLRTLRLRALGLRDGAGRGEAPVDDPFLYLQPLPDTAREIRDIASLVGADSGRDVLLGRAASETAIKTSALAKYRTLMFATHGLVPGDLRGLAEPALALANPALTGEQEDGLLTLNEILALKLHADWVVLSACNTGAADGRAAEAVSGLGRAFFYAGARALLVSNWPVETESARRLTTLLFRFQSEQPGLGRAEALRRASLALMSEALRDAQGKPLFSYAHPLFWAPFVLVGDGGG